MKTRKAFLPKDLFRLWVVSFIFTAIIHPGLWQAIAKGYPDDYLFNLSQPQIFGLIFITTVLAILLFLACVGSSYHFSIWLRRYLPRRLVVVCCTILALLLCAVALALVPQIHYVYYRFILPDLSRQWVPLGDLSAGTLWRYVLLTADDNTTHHANGFVVWNCVCAAALVAWEESQAEPF